MKLVFSDNGSWRTSEEHVIPRGFSKLLDNMFDFASESIDARSDSSENDIVFDDDLSYPFTREFLRWIDTDDLDIPLALWYAVMKSLVFAMIDGWYMRKWLRKAEFILKRVQHSDFVIDRSEIAEMLIREPWFVKINGHCPCIRINCEVIDLTPITFDILGENASVLTLAIGYPVQYNDYIRRVTSRIEFLRCSASQLCSFPSIMGNIRELHVDYRLRTLNLAQFPFLEKLTLNGCIFCALINVPATLHSLTSMSTYIEEDIAFVRQLRCINADFADILPLSNLMLDERFEKLPLLECYRNRQHDATDEHLPASLQRLTAYSYTQQTNTPRYITHLRVDIAVNIDYSLLPMLTKLAVTTLVRDQVFPKKLHTLKYVQSNFTGTVNIEGLQVIESRIRAPKFKYPTSVHTIFVKYWNGSTTELPDHVTTFEFEHYSDAPLPVYPESIIVKRRFKSIQSLYRYDSVILREPPRFF